MKLKQITSMKSFRAYNPIRKLFWYQDLGETIVIRNTPLNKTIEVRVIGISENPGIDNGGTLDIKVKGSETGHYVARLYHGERKHVSFCGVKILLGRGHPQEGAVNLEYYLTEDYKIWGGWYAEMVPKGRSQIGSTSIQN